MLVIKNKLPVDALNTFLFNSQTCENTFRIALALSGPYSSITTFTVKLFINRCEKISIINSIKTHGGQIGDYQFKFPQRHKHDKEVHVYSVNPLKQINLAEFDIEKIIQKAFESSKNYATMVNMDELLKNKNLLSLPELSQFIKTNISKSSSKVIDYMENIDFDEDSDKDEFEDENNPEAYDDQDEILSNSDDEVEDRGNVLTSDIFDTGKRNFQGCRIYDKVSPQQINKYFRIRLGSSLKYLHKQTACWILTDSKQQLSSDRLVRVTSEK